MMVRVSHINTLAIALLTGLTLSYQACSGPGDGYKYKQSPGGRADGVGGEFNGGTTTDNPKPTTTLEVGAFGESGTSNADIRLCVYEIRFQNDTQDIRAEFQPKWIVLNSAGTLIDSGLNIPFGNYSRIELRLNNSCAGLSAAVINSKGTFNLTDEMHVRFSGSVTVGGNSHMVLDMSKMISEIDDADDKSDVEEALTGTEGSCGGG